QTDNENLSIVVSDLYETHDLNSDVFVNEVYAGIASSFTVTAHRMESTNTYPDFDYCGDPDANGDYNNDGPGDGYGDGGGGYGGGYGDGSSGSGDGGYATGGDTGSGYGSSGSGAGGDPGGPGGGPGAEEDPGDGDPQPSQKTRTEHVFGIVNGTFKVFGTDFPDVDIDETMLERPSATAWLDRLYGGAWHFQVLASKWYDADSSQGPMTIGTNSTHEMSTGTESFIAERDMFVSPGIVNELETLPTVFGEENSAMNDIYATVQSSTQYGSSGASGGVIYWGDGTQSTASLEDLEDGTTAVELDHTYTEEGVYEIVIALGEFGEDDVGFVTRVMTTQAVIYNSDLIPQPEDISAAVGISTGEALLFTVPKSDWRPPEELLAAQNGTPEERAAAIAEFDIPKHFYGTIDWQDGQSQAIIDINPETFDLEIYGKHTFSAAGEFEVRLQLEDKSGIVAQQSTAISVLADWEYDGQHRTTGYDEGDVEAIGQAGVSLNTGGVFLSHALDLDFSPGTYVSGDPNLVYVSDTTHVRPIVEASFTIGDGFVDGDDATSDVVDGEARLRWGDEEWTDWEWFGTTAEAVKEDSFTVAVQLPDEMLVRFSGNYSWEIQFRMKIGDWSQEIYIADEGSTEVIVRDPQPASTTELFDEVGFYGAGWWLDFQDRLFILDDDEFVANDNDVVWATGSGGTRHWSIEDGSKTAWEAYRKHKLNPTRYPFAIKPDVVTYEPPIINNKRLDPGQLKLILEATSDLAAKLPAEIPFESLDTDEPYFEYTAHTGEIVYFNRLGLMVGVIPTYGPHVELKYDLEGRLETHIAQDSSTSTIEYAGGLYVSKIREPGSRVVDPVIVSGKLDRIQDPTGDVRNFKYDEDYNLTKVKWGIVETHFEFADDERSRSATLGIESLGSKYEIVPASAHPLREWSDIESPLLKSYEYDATIKHPNVDGQFAGYTATTQYDFLDYGVPTKQLRPDVTVTPLAAFIVTQTWEYTDIHQLERHVTPRGFETVYNYAGGYDLRSVTDKKLGTLQEHDHVTSYDYGVFNLLTKVTDAEQHSTEYKRDSKGRVYEINAPESLTTTQHWTDDDLIEYTIAPGNLRTEYKYDDFRREFERTINNKTLAGVLLPRKYKTEYDTIGNEWKVTDLSSNNYSEQIWDKVNRLVRTSTFDMLHGFGEVARNEWTYFPHGAVEIETDGEGNKSYSKYDSRGWLTSVQIKGGSDGAPGAGSPGETWTYWANGNTKTHKDLGDFETEFTYDLHLRKKTTKRSLKRGSEVAAADQHETLQQLDADGNVDWIDNKSTGAFASYVNNRAGQPLKTSVKTTQVASGNYVEWVIPGEFKYDKLGQLKESKTAIGKPGEVDWRVTA
ncbi:hypothetical protein OAH18_03405, partial [bacterium]|nr:hypothetical protein [bacterium]